MRSDFLIDIIIVSGILAGIYPDACTEETLKFIKLKFQADVLVTDHTTLQTLLKVYYIISRFSIMHIDFKVENA